MPGKEASRIEAVPPRPSRPSTSRSKPRWSPLPADDWQPDAGAIQAVLDEGYSHDDLPMLRECMFDWHDRLGRGSCNWNREFVAEAKHHADKRAAPAAKRDRQAAKDRFLAHSMAIVGAGREPPVYAWEALQ